MRDSSALFTYHVDDLVPTLRERVERMTEEEQRELRGTVSTLILWEVLFEGPTSCSRAEADLERGIFRRLLLYPSLFSMRGELNIQAIKILGTK